MKAIVQAKEKALVARQTPAWVDEFPIRLENLGPLCRVSRTILQSFYYIFRARFRTTSEHSSLLAFEEIRDGPYHLDYPGSKGVGRQASSQGHPTLGPTSILGAPRGSNTRRPGLATAKKDEPTSKPHHCIGFATLTSHVDS